MIYSRNKTNVINSVYAAKLRLQMQSTEVIAQKIDGFSLKTYGIIIIAFQIFNKLSYLWFLCKTFLSADISTKAIIVMFFLTLSNANV